MISIHLRPEQQLLILCSHKALNEPQRAELIALLHQPLDWNYLLHLADEHRVMTLLYWHLQAVGFDDVPESACAALHEQFQETAWNNPRMAYEALEIVELFEQHGIPALPYKGPMLALQVYGNLALRQFVDLDVMIPKRHFAQAKQLLQARGYRPDPEFVKVPDDEHIRTHHDYPFLSHDEEVAVELQWGVMQVPFVFPPNFESWWRKLRPTAVAGRMVLGLAPEDLLLVLCMHGAKHVWCRLVWISDVAALLHAFPQIDWSYVTRFAREVGCLRMLHLALLLAAELLDAQLPAAIAARARRDSAARRLANEVYKHLRMGKDLSDLTADITPLFYLQMMDRFQDRLWLCAYCFPSLLQPRRVFRLYGLQPFKYLLGR